MHQLRPAIGQWYLNRELGTKFEVVSIDEDEGTIELQDEEGALDEWDTENWSVIDLEATEPPEDSTALFDNSAAADDAVRDPVEPDIIDAEPLRIADGDFLDASEEEDDTR